MLRYTVVAFVCVLCGCKQGGKTCDQVVPDLVDRVVKTGVRAGAGSGGGSAVEREADKMAAEMDTGAIKTNLVGACKQDAWPPDVLACMSTAKSGHDFDACAAKLSAEQRGRADEAVKSGLAKAGAHASPECKRYADREIQCGKAKEDARPVIQSYCEKARAGDPGATYQLIARESQCAQTDGDCAAYEACTAKAK